jgi:hypothetical protein
MEFRGLINDRQTVKKLQGVACKLAWNPELQRDLMQEMTLHLIHLQVKVPGQTQSWYIKGCEFRARNYLKLGHSIDSPKRAHCAAVIACDIDELLDELRYTHSMDFRSQLMVNDLAEQIRVRLSGVQQRILDLLLEDLGVRETARRLGISHSAVVKHRQKIACVADALM